MDEKKTIKEISPRKMKVVIGLFLSLFSIILFINVTAVPRVFTFGFAYLFGFASYLFYVLIYAIGMILVFVNKPFRFKVKPLYFIAGLLLVFATFLLATHIAVVNSNDPTAVITFTENGLSRNFARKYNEVFFHFKSGNYLTQETINFFSKNYSVGCGIFGYLLLASCNALFGGKAIGGLVISIILFSIAFVVFALPIVLKIVKGRKEGKNKKNVTNDDFDLSDEEDEYIRPNYQGSLNKEPSRIEAKPETYAPSPSTNDSFFDDASYGDNIANGYFVKPIFSTGEEEADNTPKPISSERIFTESEPQPVVTPAQPVQTPIEEKPVIESPFEALERLEPTPAPKVVEKPQPQVREQMKLDFNKQPELNEALVSAKPEFDEPTTEHVAMQQATIQNEPKPEEIKKPKIVWVPPSTDLLDVIEVGEKKEKNVAVAEERQLAINNVFQNFKIGATIKGFTVGPSVTRFNVAYDASVSAKQVNNITEDIAIRLGGIPVRFVSVVEGLNCSGLEIPNAAIETVSFKDVFTELPDVKKHPLAIGFGKNISGKVICADFDEFPHLLVSGTTGSGKSIFVNSIIATLIMRNSPDELRIVLVDPKTVEMTRYKDMPHLLRPIIYTAQEALRMARKLQEEMERRYKLFSESNGATNIKEYNEDAEIAGTEKLPYILYILDEYADLIDQCKELSLPVVSLAQKARACGIHLLISTQRPSTNVVTGTIKANLPTHVALLCASSTDSVTIIGEGGAEKLLGKGDMLVQTPLISRVGCVRLQGCYASRGEITRVVNDLKSRYETCYDPNFLNLEEEAEASADEMVNSPDFQSIKEGGEEEKYQTIKEWVMSQEFMSISRIQRECQVGFNRAGRFFIRMQNEGIVDTKVEGNKGCKVLIQDKFGDDAPDVGSDEQSYFREDD